MGKANGDGDGAKLEEVRVWFVVRAWLDQGKQLLSESDWRREVGMWAATGIMGRVRKRPCLVARGGTAALTQGGVWAVRPVETSTSHWLRATSGEKKTEKRGRG